MYTLAKIVKILNIRALLRSLKLEAEVAIPRKAVLPSSVRSIAAHLNEDGFGSFSVSVKKDVITIRRTK